MNTSKLKALIDEKQLNKVRLSSMTGISDVTISNILKGADAKISSIEVLAKALEVPVGYFFDEVLVTSSANKIRGDNNVMIGNNNGVITKLENCAKEVEHLKELLAEKERLINVLLERR